MRGKRVRISTWSTVKTISLSNGAGVFTLPPLDSLALFAVPKKKKPTKSTRPRRKNNARSAKWRWLRRLAVLGCIAGLIVAVIYGVWASTFDLKKVEEIPQRSAVYDMDGKFYSRLRGQNRIVVPFDEVSKDFVNALLAREDTRFYSHIGVDPLGVARAIVRNITHASFKEGASTLTQQLARNSFDLGSFDLHRKVLEAFIALRMEQSFSKQQILQYYMNRIYFGSGFWGVETASQAYFGKAAAKLNLSESAMLVGLIRSPNRFSPFNNYKGSLRERDTVLGRMEELGMITEAQKTAAKKVKPQVAKRSEPYPQENYAMDAVNRDLDILLREEQLDEGGLRIYTTIDPALQKTAQEAVNAHLTTIEKRSGFAHPTKAQFTAAQKKREEQTPYLQGAALVIDNRTGGIRALVGGRDYSESPFNRALLSQRQVGSTFKPFVYAAAFEHGLNPSTPINDAPIQRGEISGARNWTPGNSDGKNKGRLPAAEGLIQSRNTMTVRIGDEAGVEAVRRLAAKAGLTEVPSNPAIFLGAFEENLKNMTLAYSTFPNEGTRRQPYIIERIDDESGNVLYRAAHVEAGVIAPRTALLVSSVLQDVVQRGTASAAKRLGMSEPAGGKTGTTNDFKDAWFIGYTSSLTCGVWAGFDQPRKIMNGGYGSTLALPIWARIMSKASSQRYPANRLARVAIAQPVRNGRGGGRDNEPSLPGKIIDSFRNFFRR